MIELDTFKQILIKNGTTELTEEQIVELRDQQDQMAEIFFSVWHNEIKNKTEV